MNGPRWGGLALIAFLAIVGFVFGWDVTGYCLMGLGFLFIAMLFTGELRRE